MKKPYVLSWKTYVDECFYIVRKYEINYLLTYIKRIKENKQFTIENEENGRLPLLDTTIIRNDNGSFNPKVCRKPNPNDRYLDYNSSSQVLTSRIQQ